MKSQYRLKSYFVFRRVGTLSQGTGRGIGFFLVGVSKVEKPEFFATDRKESLWTFLAESQLAMSWPYVQTCCSKTENNDPVSLMYILRAVKYLPQAKF
jgi:hypothetical protein